MGKTVGFIYLVEWGNPYTAPPVGEARVKAVYFEPSDGRRGAASPPGEIEGLVEIGSGYALKIGFLEQPLRARSAEQLRDSRRKRLGRKMKQDVGFFAAHFEAEAVGRNPEYYEGRSRYEAEREAALEVERERFEFLTAHAGEVLRGEDWPELERLFGVVKTR